MQQVISQQIIHLRLNHDDGDVFFRWKYLNFDETVKYYSAYGKLWPVDPGTVFVSHIIG